MKLWEKEKKTQKEVLDFTVGNDREFDVLLAPYDVMGSIAHSIMLGETGIITKKEAGELLSALKEYYPVTRKKSFSLNPGEEDIHSHLENYLVEKLGDTGKKIHTGRSRNDQVMTALLLYMRNEYGIIIDLADSLFHRLIEVAEENKNVIIPGYTHTQVAMPSSIALWLGAYAESLVNDLQYSEGIIKVIDQNPLGSAAGFGSSFPIDRNLTTQILGFSGMMVSSLSAQLNRGKIEMLMASGMSSFANTLSRLASDMILYMSQNFKFISFPEELTTGSSIMPHKKNPDVLELIRAHCNLIMQLPMTLNGLTSNLISGYHRDFQLTKEVLIPGIIKIKNVLEIMDMMVGHMQIEAHIMEDEKYRFIFSVEEVNKKVMKGKSFRDAYREVGKEIESGVFAPSGKISYTHIGSIGNPGLEIIKKKWDQAKSRFHSWHPDEILMH